MVSSDKCIASSNKCLTSSNKKLLGAPGLTTRNKKLQVTSASLLVTSALLVVRSQDPKPHGLDYNMRETKLGAVSLKSFRSGGTKTAGPKLSVGPTPTTGDIDLAPTTRRLHFLLMPLCDQCLANTLWRSRSCKIQSS